MEHSWIFPHMQSEHRNIPWNIVSPTKHFIDLNNVMMYVFQYHTIIYQYSSNRLLHLVIQNSRTHDFNYYPDGIPQTYKCWIFSNFDAMKRLVFLSII